MSEIGLETAQKIAAAWDGSASMRDAMRKAGIETNDARNMHRYRRQAEELLGIQLQTLAPKHAAATNWPARSERYDLDHEYTAVIYSDAHFWPTNTGPAFWLLLQILDELKPEVVIDAGDSWDGATISRFAPNMWETQPTLVEELKTVQAHLEMIEDAAPDADRFRCIGNHDMRIEAKLASMAPEFKGMPNTRVSDFFPKWRHNLSVVLNDSTIVKHRQFSGVHAAWNNVLKAGVNIVTGHTHRLLIREYTDYRGTRYGVEAGTLASPYGDQFAYCEDGFRDWRQGFIVLTVDGSDIYPEKVELKDGKKALFRGRWYTP